MKQKLFLNIIGIFFIILGIVGIIINLIEETSYNIIWFCNHTSIILGIAFLLKSSFWITAELNIGVIPQFLWSLDFLGKLIFHKYLFGFTDYMFSPTYPKSLYILSWNHLLIIPLALIGLYILKNPSKTAWKGSVLHGLLLIPISHIYQTMNLNCMLESCVFFIPTASKYKYYWPLVMLLVVILPTNYLIYRLYSKQKKL